MKEKNYTKVQAREPVSLLVCYISMDVSEACASPKTHKSSQKLQSPNSAPYEGGLTSGRVSSPQQCSLLK